MGCLQNGEPKTSNCRQSITYIQEKLKKDITDTFMKPKKQVFFRIIETSKRFYHDITKLLISNLSREKTEVTGNY